MSALFVLSYQGELREGGNKMSVQYNLQYQQTGMGQSRRDKGDRGHIIIDTHSGVITVNKQSLSINRHDKAIDLDQYYHPRWNVIKVLDTLKVSCQHLKAYKIILFTFQSFKQILKIYFI